MAGGFWGNFRIGQEARESWDDRGNRRQEREARMAQRGALREEFGDRSGGSVADVAVLNDVDTNLAERRRGAQVAGLGIVRQILAAPPEQQDALAAQYAPALAPAFGVGPDEVLRSFSAIRSSPNPEEAIQALQGALVDPALNQLVGAPNMIDEEGYAAGVTRGGAIRRFEGYRPTTSYNVDRRAEVDLRRDLTPARQAGVQYEVDPETGQYTGRIIEGTPQATEQATAEVALQQALTDAQAPTLARQRLTDELTNIGNRYVELWNAGGAVDSRDPNVARRIRNMVESTALGRVLSRMSGSQNESLRQEIVNARDRLLPAIMQAEGAGARMFDSNAEREGFLRALSDPGQDIYAALASIDQLSRRLGIGGVADIIDMPATLRENVRPNAGGGTPAAAPTPSPAPRNEAPVRAPVQGRSREDSLDDIRARLRGNR